MESVFQLISEVGIPIATALVMMWFLFMVMQQIIGNTVSQIKLLESFAKSLTTRVRTLNNDLIKLDTSVSAALGLKPDIEGSPR